MARYQARKFQIQVMRLTEFLTGTCVTFYMLHTAKYKKTDFVIIELEPSFRACDHKLQQEHVKQIVDL